MSNQDNNPEPPPPPSNESIEQWNQRMKWWKDAKFGMFIHYGLYSGLEADYKGSPLPRGQAEWYQQVVGLDSVTYENMAMPKFKPSEEATAIWTDLAVKAGCQYVVLTSKHHEGFGLFESKLGDFNAKARINRDLVHEYVANCRDRNLKVGLYHSLIDWHHAHYDSSSQPTMPYPEGEKERTKHVKRDHSKYLEYLHGQVEEILTNYGNLDILWFDFSHFGFDG
jgi:alpha-L-fucosidase